MVQSSQVVRSTKKKKHQKHKNQKKTSQGTIQQQSDTEDIPSHKKTKNSTYGIIPSANYTLIIAADYQSDQEVEMST